jgi:hypothetical protein
MYASRVKIAYRRFIQKQNHPPLPPLNHCGYGYYLKCDHPFLLAGSEGFERKTFRIETE